MNAQHPSSIALDLLALGHEDTTVRAHAAQCERCRAHLAEAAPGQGPVPAWVSTAAPTKRPRWRLAAIGGFATAAVALVVTQQHLMTDPPGRFETRAKGQPSFALYLERAGTLTLWDGKAPVATGDRLQLKVAAAGFDYLQVGVSTADGGWHSVFHGAVKPESETIVPESWVVDDADPVLHLGFLLCDGRCDATALPAAAQQAPRDSHQWWSEFTLRRSTP